MKRSILAAAVLICLLLSGCAKQPEYANGYDQPVFFFYCRKDGNYGSSSGALAGEVVDLGKGEYTLQEILNRYFRGPNSETLYAPFPAGLKCEEAAVEDRVAYLRLSSTYADVYGVEKSLIDACLTMTVLNIMDVDEVRVDTDAATIGQSGQLLAASDYLLEDLSAENPERTVFLYFAAGEMNCLRAERRAVSYGTQNELPGLVMDALLSGPMREGSVSVIPEQTRWVDLSVDDGLCTVVFNEAFADCDVDRQTASMAVESVVASLCALQEIERVQIMLITGGDLQFYSIEEPISAEKTWFE